MRAGRAENTEMSFSESLKRHRLEKGLTVLELSKISGVPFQLIYRYEKGEAGNVTLRTLGRLAEALGIDPGDLLG